MKEFFYFIINKNPIYIVVIVWEKLLTIFISFLTGLATPAGKLINAMLVSLLCLNIYPLLHFSSTGQSGEQWAQCPPPPTWTPWLSTLVLHHGFPSGSVSVVQPVLVLSSNMKGNWHSFPLPGPSTVTQRSERKYCEISWTYTCDKSNSSWLHLVATTKSMKN